MLIKHNVEFDDFLKTEIPSSVHGKNILIDPNLLQSEKIFQQFILYFKSIAGYHANFNLCVYNVYEKKLTETDIKLRFSESGATTMRCLTGLI